MKTRNGFVSNSSSSSFVVAFPKMPNSESDVLNFMFNGKEGGVSVYDYDGLSYAQVAKIVFDDLEHKNAKAVALKDIVELFYPRYHYYPGGHSVFWIGRTNDEHGGAETGHCGRYYGNDKELMEQLRKMIVEDEGIEKSEREEEARIKRRIGPRPAYAYKGGENPYTKKPYTAKEIKAHDDYYEKEKEFIKNDKEYKDFDTKRWERHRIHWDKVHKLQEKIAKEDAQNFLDDNKGKFVFIVSYSDNDGAQGCTMEHGNIFRNVPHVAVSQH